MLCENSLGWLFEGLKKPVCQFGEDLPAHEAQLLTHVHVHHGLADPSSSPDDLCIPMTRPAWS